MVPGVKGVRCKITPPLRPTASRIMIRTKFEESILKKIYGLLFRIDGFGMFGERRVNCIVIQSLNIKTIQRATRKSLHDDSLPEMSQWR